MCRTLAQYALMKFRAVTDCGWLDLAGGGLVTGRMFAGPIILLLLDLLHGARSYVCVHLCQTKGAEHSGVTSEIRGGQGRAEEAHMQCPSHLARLWLRT